MSNENSETNESGKGGGFIVSIIVIVIVLFFGRGQDGFICKHIYFSARTQTEREFWALLAGCNCQPTPVSGAAPSLSFDQLHDLTGEDPASQLLVAAAIGNADEVGRLLESGVEVDTPGPEVDQVPAGVTALMIAAARNHLEVVELLLSKGADPNVADEGGGTALIYASWKGHVDVVRVLLENGGDYDVTTRDGRTPLGVARNEGHAEVVDLLEDYAERELEVAPPFSE